MCVLESRELMQGRMSGKHTIVLTLAELFHNLVIFSIKFSNLRYIMWFLMREIVKKHFHQV